MLFFSHVHVYVVLVCVHLYDLRILCPGGCCCTCCCCCCCCSHINSHNQVRGHRTGSSHSGAEEYPRENKHTHSPRWYTHISQLTQCMPPPETYKSKIGSQSTMCQVQAGAYVSLLTPGETKYSDCHPRKTTTYILHVVSITTHTHDRRKSIGEKETKKRKEDNPMRTAG